MDFRPILSRTRSLLIGEAVCTALMAAVFALLDMYDATVLPGGIAGSALAAANFFLMALTADTAIEKARRQDGNGAQAMLLLSYLGRMAGLLLMLALCAGSGLFHPLALVLPLFFAQPVLTLAELIHRKGGEKA